MTYKVQIRYKPTQSPMEPWETMPGCSNCSLLTAVCIAVGDIRNWRNKFPYQAVRIIDNDTRDIWAQWSTESKGNEA